MPPARAKNIVIARCCEESQSVVLREVQEKRSQSPQRLYLAVVRIVAQKHDVSNTSSNDVIKRISQGIVSLIENARRFHHIGEGPQEDLRFAYAKFVYAMIAGKMIEMRIRDNGDGRRT